MKKSACLSNIHLPLTEDKNRRLGAAAEKLEKSDFLCPAAAPTSA
jgi:hypothetical protein